MSFHIFALSLPDDSHTCMHADVCMCTSTTLLLNVQYV